MSLTVSGPSHAVPLLPYVDPRATAATSAQTSSQSDIVFVFVLVSVDVSVLVAVVIITIVPDFVRVGSLVQLLSVAVVVVVCVLLSRAFVADLSCARLAVWLRNVAVRCTFRAEGCGTGSGTEDGRAKGCGRGG